MKQNEFDNETKYRLFRTVKEILHPSISKKNISDYNIIIEEDILPVRVFYPKKVTGISRVMIMIHGNAKVTDCMEKYSDICKNLSIKSNSLVIALEYEEEKENYTNMLEQIYNTIKYLYERLEKNNIDPNNIILVGDSTGGMIITGINYLNKEEINIKKEILFYPTLSLDYFTAKEYKSLTDNKHFNFDLLSNLKDYYTFIASSEERQSPILNPIKETSIIPKTLLFVGKVDLVRDECIAYQEKYKDLIKYIELPFASHSFLKKMDHELEEEVIEEINKFMV